MSKFTLFIYGVFLVFATVCFVQITTWSSLRIPVVSAQSNVFHVTGQALPASLTIPATLQGKSLDVGTGGLSIDMLVIANTDTSAHTVTVSDCQASPFLLFNSYPIAASSMWTVPLNGTRFQGCIKWSANSTTVMGTIVGRR